MDSCYTLKLSRFKKFESLTLQIPSTGIILLDGKNGVGKTTLFEAITFAMYDNAGNSCYPRKDRNSKKKLEPTSVELSFPNGLVIHRQRRPNLLRVSGPGIELMDEVAQGYINRIYGPYNAWLAGGYLEQEKPCAFFSMSAAEKLDFLQELSLMDRQGFSGPEQFEAYLNKVATRYNEMTQQWKEIEFQMKLNYEMYMRLYNNMPGSYREFTPWTDDRVDRLSELLSQTKNETVVKTQGLQNSLSELRLQLLRFSEYTLQKERLEKSRDELEKAVSEIQSTENLGSLEEDLSSVHQQIELAKRTQRHIQLMTVKTELQKRLSLISTEKSSMTLTEVENYERLLKGPSVEEYDRQLKKLFTAKEYYTKFGLYQKRESLQSQLQGLKRTLETYPQKSFQNEIDEISKKIWATSMREKKLVCPKCTCDLYLNNGQLTPLEIHECLPQNHLQELQQTKVRYQQEETRYRQREQIEQQIQLITQQLEQFDAIHSNKLQGFDVSQKPDFVATIPQIDHLIEQMRLQKEKREHVPVFEPDLERKRINDEFERSRLQKDISLIDSELSGLNAQKSTNEDVTLLETQKSRLIAEIETLRKIEMTRVAKKATLQQILNQLNSLQKVEAPTMTVQSLEDELQRTVQEGQRKELEITAQIYLTEMSKLYRQYETQQKNYQEVSLKLGSLQKIRSCLVTAEYIVLDNVLSQINTSIAEVLDQLFVEPVSVTLRSMKQLKSEDRIKPEINCEIVVDGVECGNIREVSGGERSRICLAMIIAFSSYSNIPFVFLDEALSALDVSSKESTINTIRKHLQNKLVIAVNHDTTKGVYDSVIALE